MVSLGASSGNLARYTVNIKYNTVPKWMTSASKVTTLSRATQKAADQAAPPRRTQNTILGGEVPKNEKVTANKTPDEDISVKTDVKKPQDSEQVEVPNKLSSEELAKLKKAKRMETAAEVIESVCSDFTEILLKQIDGSEEYNLEELAEDIAEKMNDMKKIIEIQTQTKAGTPPSKTGSCLEGVHSAAVEWATTEVEDTLKAGETTTSAGLNTDLFVVKCENFNNCNAQSSGVKVDIKFNAAALPPSTTASNIPVQSTQPLASSTSQTVESHIASSSASSFNQYSSFRDSNSVALTMTLMVLLYMYIFNFRR